MNLAVQSSSHFNGSLTAILHARPRGVSAQYIYRSVDVGMIAVTTMLTGKDRLALAARSVDGPARRAGLRRVHGRHFNQRPAAFFEFVSKDGLEDMPALVEDRSVQPSLSPDVATRRFSGPGGACRHIGNLQIFHNNGAETFSDVQRCLVVPIAADASAFCGQSSTALDRLKSSFRPLLTTRNNALCGAHTALDGTKANGDGHHLAGRESQGIGHATVDADAGENISWRNVLNFTGEANVPTIGAQTHGRVLDRSATHSGIAKFYPSDSGQPNRRPFRADAANGYFGTLKSKTFIDPLLSGQRILGSAHEKRAEGFLQITQRLILSSRGYCGNPVKLSPQQCQIPALGCAVNVLAVRPKILPPKITPLNQSQIVNQTTHPGVLPEGCLLFNGWAEFVSEGAENHSRNLA